MALESNFRFTAASNNFQSQQLIELKTLISCVLPQNEGCLTARKLNTNSNFAYYYSLDLV